MRSWTHSKGLPVASCASRNPAQPPSRGCAANSSERVWAAAAVGRAPPSPELRSERSAFSSRPDLRDSSAGDQGKAPATQLTTFLFYFCSLSRESERRVNAESARLGRLRALADSAGLRIGCSSGGASISRQCDSATPAQRRPTAPQAGMIGVDLDRFVDAHASRPRAALGATIPSRRDHKASVGTGGLSVARGNGGSLTSWPGDPLVEFARRWCWS